MRQQSVWQEGTPSGLKNIGADRHCLEKQRSVDEKASHNVRGAAGAQVSIRPKIGQLAPNRSVGAPTPKHDLPASQQQGGGRTIRRASSAGSSNHQHHRLPKTQTPRWRPDLDATTNCRDPNDQLSSRWIVPAESNPVGAASIRLLKVKDPGQTERQSDRAHAERANPFLCFHCLCIDGILKLISHSL